MRIQKRNSWRKAQMQQPQKDASTWSTWLALHSSWMCAVSTLCWSAHPRLQPRASIWQESEAQSRETSPPTHTPSSHGCSSLQSTWCGCRVPIPERLRSQQRGHKPACDNLLTGQDLLPAASHMGDADNLEMLLARMSVVLSQATLQLLAWAAPSWFCRSLLWHSLGASQESSTELAVTTCPAVCPQLWAAETQLRIAMVTPGLIPSSALAKAQLKAHLQIAG